MVARGRVRFRYRADPAGRAGLAMAVFALAVYPLLGWLAGHGWPAHAGVFGVAPCPVTLFTLAMLLLVEGRMPWHLAAIPLLWSLIGASAVWLLDMPEDLSLLAAGLCAVVLFVVRNRKAREALPSDVRS